MCSVSFESLLEPRGCCASPALSSLSPGCAHGHQVPRMWRCRAGPTGAAVLETHRHSQLIDFKMPLLPLPGSMGGVAVVEGEKSEYPTPPHPSPPDGGFPQRQLTRLTLCHHHRYQAAGTPQAPCSEQIRGHRDTGHRLVSAQGRSPAGFGCRWRPVVLAQTWYEQGRKRQFRSSCIWA